MDRLHDGDYHLVISLESAGAKTVDKGGVIRIY